MYFVLTRNGALLKSGDEVAGSPLVTLCASHTITETGQFPHAVPYSSPDLVAISAGMEGWFSFQSTNSFLWGQDVSVLFELSACSDVLLYTLYFPRHLLQAPKGEYLAT